MLVCSLHFFFFFTSKTKTKTDSAALCSSSVSPNCCCHSYGLLTALAHVYCSGTDTDVSRGSFPGGHVKTHKPQWIHPTFPLDTAALTHAVRTMRNMALPVLSLCLSLHFCGQHEAASGMINSEGGRSWRGPLLG